MDNYADRNRIRNYFLTMANLEASALASTANFISHTHLKDGSSIINFQDDVTRFISVQLNTIRNENSSEAECKTCLQNLKQEHEYLKVQDRMLQSGEAMLHASVQFVKNDKVQHWVINGVGILLSGMQVVAGFGVAVLSLRAGSVIGTGFGAMLILHGANGVVEGGLNLFTGKDDSQGFLKKYYIEGAEFFGFDQKTGELAYTSMDLLLSAYGMARLVRKPEAYRLFYYLSTDYVRGINNMSRFDLGVEIYNDSMAIKSIYNDVKDD